MKPSPVFLLLTASRKACLLASALVAAFAASPALAQYADWAANPPKILPNERPGSGAAFSTGSGRQFPNPKAFAAITMNGSVVTWGAPTSGGNSSAVAASLSSNVTAVYSNGYAFAALKDNGAVVTWGQHYSGGDSSAVASSLTSNVTAVYSTVAAFAALKDNGSVITWGTADFGGNSSAVAASLSSGVKAVYSNAQAFAALKDNGSVVTWGVADWGGNSTNLTGGNLSSNVTAVYSNQYAFAALKTGGSVVTWGSASWGGNSSAVAASLSSNVTAVYSTYYAFAALKSNGSVVTWGSANSGGDSSAVAASLSSNVTAVYSNGNAFAALNSNGSVVTWGQHYTGGNSTSVAASLTSNVTAVYSTEGAFAALKSNGSVVTWGLVASGGNSTSVADKLASNVTAVYSTETAFAALKTDGSVVTWGDADNGGDSTNVTGGNLTSGVKAVQSAFYYQYGPSLSTSTGNITSTTTTLLGEVVSQGNSPVTARGFVYALASVSDPKIGDAGVTQVAVSGSGLGSYSQLLSGLTPNTAYVFRAYVVNGEGTTYSSAQNFSTNLPPVITSHGGNTTVSLNVEENSTAVSTVSATDADAGQTITYSISGGADAARFAIGSTSGVLTFAAAPDFEAPADADANNVYTVIVRATDNGNTPKSATQTLTVTVTNVLDNGILAVEQPAGTPLASGNGSVGFGNLTIGQSNERIFTLRSQGEAALFLPSGAVISGAAASDFSLVDSAPASLATGDNTTFTVRFSPTASGNRSATLSIPTNDTRPGRSRYTITLTGNGSATPTVATYTSAASQVLGGWVNGGNFTIGTVGTTSNATNWPAAESPDKVVDANTGTKFLIYRNSHTGVILKPTNSSLVFNRLSLSTANDAPERDPASFILYGSSSNLTGNASTNIPISSLTQIASGNVTMLDTRNAGPTVIQFANSVAYTSYVVVFPTVRSTVNNNLMQISEIQLSQGINPPLAVAMADARGGQLSGGNFSFGSIGNNNPETNWLAGESPDHAMDGNVNTKFAIFRSTGAGLLASPQAGSARMNTLTLWTANDSPERDPATYQVYGFSTRITQTSSPLAVGNGTLLANGTMTLPADRNSGPVQVDFDNGTAYASYLVVFPTVKNSPSTNLMQVSEVQFSYNGIPDFSISSPVVSLNENSGAQSNAAFATGITAGLGDVGQTVSFACTNNNNALFSAQPAISANGTLTFTTAPDAHGNATVTVVVTDNFGSSSAPKTFRVDVAIVPAISPSASSLGNFSTTAGMASGSQSFTVNGRALAGPITLTASVGFEISTDNSTFSSSLSVNNPTGTPIPATIYARISSTSPGGTVSGNITLTSQGAQTQTVTLSGTVARFISASANSLGNFSTEAGTASGSQSFTVDGRALAGPITLTAPAGFEISTDNSTFSSSLSVNKPGTIQSVYRGAFGNSTTASGKIWSMGSGTEFPNFYAFAALKNDGSVVTWGNADYGGDSTAVASNLSSNVTAVYSNRGAFAAVKADGSVVTWGNESNGGNSTAVASELSSNVTAVYSNQNAFAALKTNGSVVTWGNAYYVGDSLAVASSLSSNVTAVYSNQNAFAALKTDGSVVTWGAAYYGGNSTAVASELSSNVTAVYSNQNAFAALKADRSVVTWGHESNGGNSTAVASNLSSNVTAVYSNQNAFAALKADGSVVTWGAGYSSGNSTAVASSLSSGVTAVYSTKNAFAALKADGSVVTWDNGSNGGNSTAVASSLSSGVTAVYSNENAFAALKADGSVVTWGYGIHGGNSTAVASNLASNVTAVYSTQDAFAALKADGSIVTWGNESNGGNSTAVASNLSSNVTAVYSTAFTFAAVKNDGSVVIWGNANYGGSGAPTNIGVGAPIPATIYTRLSSTAPAGSVSGNLTLTSSGAGNQTVALSGTVSSAATPAITASPASLSGLTASLGSVSAALPFLVGGTDLTANITISAPTGFEISSTGSAPFASSLNLAPVSGTVASTSVYARLAASAAAGVNSGNITLASTGATSQQVAVSGTVTLPYEDWVAYWNTQSGSFSDTTALGSADPDGDGLSNTTEFAFQGDPLSPTASLISVAPAGGNITVTFLARVGNGTIWTGGNATGHGLDYQIQSSGNLTLGFGTTSDVLNITPAADQTGIQAADFPYVRWEFQAPISGDKKFYRVRALPQGDQ